VRADLEEARGAGHLRLAVSRLDLGRLPPLLPAALASAGKLDLDVDLRLSATRLRGSVAMHGLGTGLRAKLDLPATWPPRTDGRAPMQLALTVDETDLGTAAKTVAALTTKKPPVDLGGKVRLSATLDGSAEHPRLDLRFAGHALTLAGRPLGDLAVQLEGEGDRPLALKVGATAPGLPPATLEATTPLSLGALFHRRLSVAALTRTPFEINGQITEVPLALVGKLIGQPIFRAGTISVAVAAHGSAEKPVGTLAVDLKGATTPRIPATDARVEIEVAERATKANVRIVRLGRVAIVKVDLGDRLFARRRGTCGTEGRDLDDLAAEEDVCQAEAPPDQAAVAEQALDLFWQRIGCYVEVLGFDPQQQVADAAAD